MEEHKDPMILTAASIIFMLLLLGYAKMASGSDGNKLLEGLTPTAAGYCVDNHGTLYPCVKYTKKGEAWFYLAIFSADASELIYICRIEGVVQSIVWQKGLRL